MVPAANSEIKMVDLNDSKPFYGQKAKAAIPVHAGHTSSKIKSCLNPQISPALFRSAQVNLRQPQTRTQNKKKWFANIKRFNYYHGVCSFSWTQFSLFGRHCCPNLLKAFFARRWSTKRADRKIVGPTFSPNRRRPFVATLTHARTNAPQFAIFAAINKRVGLGEFVSSNFVKKC